MRTRVRGLVASRAPGVPRGRVPVCAAALWVREGTPAAVPLTPCRPPPAACGSHPLVARRELNHARLELGHRVHRARRALRRPARRGGAARVRGARRWAARLMRLP